MVHRGEPGLRPGVLASSAIGKARLAEEEAVYVDQPAPPYHKLGETALLSLFLALFTFRPLPWTPLAPRQTFTLGSTPCVVMPAPFPVIPRFLHPRSTQTPILSPLRSTYTADAFLEGLSPSP